MDYREVWRFGIWPQNETIAVSQPRATQDGWREQKEIICRKLVAPAARPLPLPCLSVACGIIMHAKLKTSRPIARLWLPRFLNLVP
jgi:hypothetical protein